MEYLEARCLEQLPVEGSNCPQLSSHMSPIIFTASSDSVPCQLLNWFTTTWGTQTAEYLCGKKSSLFFLNHSVP